MKEENKISIIVPAYNCEKNIEMCIKSILNQTYPNLEIIIVNDGSTDNTLEILNNLRKNDNRIIVIDKKNTGVSDTRNIGLNAATGNYIGFVDSDDYIEEYMYEQMYNLMLEKNSDISICSYYEINEKEKTEKLFPWKEQIKIFIGEDISEELLPHYIYKLKNESGSIYGTVWRMLIKSDIAKKVKFEREIKIAEDLIYVIDCFSLATNIIAINNCLYNYIIYKQSSVGKYKPDLYYTNQLVHKALIDRLNRVNFFKNHKIRYQLNRCYMYTSSISNIVKNRNETFSKKREKVKELVNRFNEDKYMNKKIISELEISRKLIFIFMKMKVYTIITVLFILKFYYANRRKKND